MKLLYFVILYFDLIDFVCSNISNCSVGLWYSQTCIQRPMQWLPCIIRSPYNFPKILPYIFCNVIPVYGSHLSKTKCRHTLELLNAQFHYFLLVMYISITKINWILIKQLMNHNKLYSKGLTLSPAFSLG